MDLSNTATIVANFAFLISVISLGAAIRNHLVGRELATDVERETRNNVLLNKQLTKAMRLLHVDSVEELHSLYVSTYGEEETV